MSKIERFEDIQAWQKARCLAKDVYDVSNRGVLPRILDFEIKYGVQQFQ